MSHPTPQSSRMTTRRLPGRRTFIRLLGLLCGAPAVAGADPQARCPAFAPDGPDWLLAWKNLPRHPVTSSDHPLTATLLRAAADGRAVALYYHGGSQPGRLRRFSPELVFRPEGLRHDYVSGFCHLRQAPRVLRVDRIALA